jgi:large conductance mechanosensitive channel
MARFLARRAAKQKQAAEEQPTAETEEVVLLREIRDALIHQRGAAALIDQRGPSEGR